MKKRIIIDILKDLKGIMYNFAHQMIFL